MLLPRQTQPFFYLVIRRKVDDSIRLEFPLNTLLLRG
jgi:hypothetical protein